MISTTSFARTAALIGDPARASMLAALLDGRALTATELARVAGVTPQTASGHLARLTEGGLLCVARQGRHRYHRLASAAVAGMLESLMSVSGELADDAGATRAPRVGPHDKALRLARTCYDHLAGEVAVAIADAMAARGEIDLSPDGAALSEAGLTRLNGLGIDLTSVDARRRAGGRVFCRPCLDWSERRVHIAGAVGAALYRGLVARAWLRPIAGTRAVSITPSGNLGLAEAFEVRVDAQPAFRV